MNLKNKRILITAGPTWVAIDNVRVISNIASGDTGVMLAERLIGSGAKVTLILGPAGACCLNKKIRLLRFNFFAEFKKLICQELKSKKYDIVVHSAAVSDYRPFKVLPRKIKSGLRRWKLNLVPTVKIIDLIKKIDAAIYLVGFKFEPGAGKAMLIKNTRALIKRANLDIAVANTPQKNKYRAYILKQDKIYGPLLSKNKLVDKLANIIMAL